MKIGVTRYRKPDGYATRFWSVTVNGELLAVTVYRNGAVTPNTLPSQATRRPSRCVPGLVFPRFG